MDLLQADKNNLLSAKKSDNQNNFCPASCYFSLSNRCRKSLPGKPNGARRRGRLTSELLSLQVGFSARHIEDTPKALVAVLSKHVRNMLILNDGGRKKNSFQKYVSAFGNKSVWVHNVIPISWRVKAEELQRNSFFFLLPPPLPPWKLICDPLMKSSSFGIKLNVQRYLSVGISLITQREVSDRLMQVLTWVSPRTLYMYPATDRYC